MPPSPSWVAFGSFQPVNRGRCGECERVFELRHGERWMVLPPHKNDDGFYCFGVWRELQLADVTSEEGTLL